ncbi:iron ABC transporter ATP-binding protein [Echinicola pacifica]|uniref:Iron ABC transporter ATP-binding protein n=1 Tax=Echinicola pacifica TaxID=346377 RepID=A0A918URB7_9BACT|nr:ABC transporter ATP-binding protein [Echinicola pacifica]GGZ28119.1 iron ABC transporter ATP-binding protein [Echinicola pacifica]
MSFLKVTELSKHYNNTHKALENFSLQLPKGGILSMVGESGSGKSSLLRIIAGLEVQSAGLVHLGDQKILNPDQKLVAGYDEIQLIHQEYKLYPNSTVEENIARPLLLYDKAYQKERTETLLSMLRLQDHRNKKPRQLSGGQQQKVAIARALSIEPEVLLLDEPFSSLDVIQKRILIEELKDIFEELKVTVIFVTHEVEDAMLMSEDLVVIQKGEIVQQGKAQELVEQPASEYVARLFGFLNKIPKMDNTFIRPIDIRVSAKGELMGKVLSKQYLLQYNLLKVEVADEVWRIVDFQRALTIGESIGLDFDESNFLKFKA